MRERGEKTRAGRILLFRRARHARDSRRMAQEGTRGKGKGEGEGRSPTSKSARSTLVLLRRAATMAASLQMLAMSAPVKPGRWRKERGRGGEREGEGDDGERASGYPDIHAFYTRGPAAPPTRLSPRLLPVASLDPPASSRSTPGVKAAILFATSSRPVDSFTGFRCTYKGRERAKLQGKFAGSRYIPSRGRFPSYVMRVTCPPLLLPHSSLHFPPSPFFSLLSPRVP